MNQPGIRICQLLMMLVSFTGGRPGFAEPLADEAMPSLEMLEFLADWETVDGQWIDPAILERDVPKQPMVDEHDES